MNTVLWSDEQLRSFINTLRDRACGSDSEAEDRAAFMRQAEARIVPRARREVLAAVGAVTSADGVASVAFDVLEHEIWSKRRSWLMVTTDPWALLTDAVTREVCSSYRASLRKSDRKALKGIAAASSRPELESGAPGPADGDAH
ncbi:MAG: hypothetical protein FWD85_04015 [Microbacteriaceae bacterium]|nr:hypothetical protein [Microbacteriaceae bacterium]MCL2794454.1 hypothetical protein [Microbacteriaceae bacterium]